MNAHWIWRALLAGIFVVPALAIGDDLRSVLKERIQGDRSGVCLVAARVTDEVEWAQACADPESDRGFDRESRFEIGSVTKAMQGIVVSSLARDGVLDIDEPLADLLPEGALVPRHGDKPIRIRHLLTHTSGLPRLPPNMPMNDPHDPYADLDTETLLDLLAKTRLSRVPGEAFEYSNFGAMLLTLAVTNRSGQDFDRLLEGVLFEPLGMDTAGVGGPVVQGHDARGKPVKPWTFNVNLAGVGGVRASLDDMIRFVQANLAFPDDTTGQAIARSHQVLASPDNQRLAWGWLKLSVNGKTVVFHNGGTAGMTAEVAIDPDQGTGVIILADTGLAAQGGFTDLALQLLTQSSR